MKKIIISVAVTALLLWSCADRTQKTAVSVPRIIFDTDLGPDYDDVGAIAILHAMADSGRAEILATLASNKNELVVPSINVLNTYFGRPGLPTGAPKGPGVSLGSSQHWADSIVNKYPHTITSTSSSPDAVTIYRKVLSSQPDSSVTIVTVGFLTNLNNLLKTQPDSISSLDGLQLVTKKVKLLVSMAGWFPEGREFNIDQDSAASKYVFENWPGHVIFTGFEVGDKIQTGLRIVNNNSIKNNPVKDVYRISMPLSEEDKAGRKSWDLTAVIIAVYGTNGFFTTQPGKILIDERGFNKWQNDQAGKQEYVILKMPVSDIAAFLEDRMMHQPNIITPKR